MNQETELKLAFPAPLLPALLRHPLVAGAPKQGRAVTLHNTYFDTPAFELRARGIAVRTRRQGGKWLQTVKCAAPSTAGLSQRPEWEQPWRGAFDFSAVDAPETAATLARCRDALIPVFTTRFRRETRLHTPREGVRILLMADTGAVEADGRAEPIHELELELESGTAADLLELACALARDLPLLPSDLSKAGRGYRLFHNQGPRAEQAEAPALRADHSVSAAFRELAHGCLRQWQANAAAAAALGADGNDGDGCAECIHPLRVALRRLRTLIRFFAPALPDGFAPAWNRRLRDLAAAFSHSRDIEALHAGFLAPLATAERACRIDGLPRLLTRADDARRSARAAALERIGSDRHGLALLEFSADLLRLPENTPGATDTPGRFAQRRLARLRQKARLRFEAARASGASSLPARLHALRIALKQLRYGIAFFTPLLPQKTARRALSRLTRIQTALGNLNDAARARDLLAAWADEDATLRTAAAHITQQIKKHRTRRQRRALCQAGLLLWGKKPW